MWEWFVKYWLQVAMGAISTVFAGALGYLQSKLKRLRGLEKGLRVILYDRLWQAHRFYINQGWISVPDFRNIGYLYEAYHDLGGNGTGTKLYTDMKRLPSQPPQKSESEKEIA